MKPDTLGYKANSGIKSILVIASLFGSVSVEGQFARLEAIFASVLNCESSPSLGDSPELTSSFDLTARICSPLTVLRSLLHFVHDHIADLAFCSELRNYLAPVDLPALPEATQQHEDKVSATSSFVNKLFGETLLEQLRCREAVARFMLVSGFEPVLALDGMLIMYERTASTSSTEGTTSRYPRSAYDPRPSDRSGGDYSPRRRAFELQGHSRT